MEKLLHLIWKPWKHTKLAIGNEKDCQCEKHTDSEICCCSVAESCPTLCNPMNCSTPGFLVLHYLPEFAQTYVYWIGDAIQPSHSLSPPSPPALNHSQHQGLFQWINSTHQVAKSWSFSISPSNEYSGLISFTTDWFYILAVRGTLKNLLQHHNLKALFLWCWAFLMVQISHLHMTIGKTIALATQTFVGKVFFPRSKSLLIWWLQSPSAVSWSPRK